MWLQLLAARFGRMSLCSLCKLCMSVLAADGADIRDSYRGLGAEELGAVLPEVVGQISLVRRSQHVVGLGLVFRHGCSCAGVCRVIGRKPHSVLRSLYFCLLQPFEERSWRAGRQQFKHLYT